MDFDLQKSCLAEVQKAVLALVLALPGFMLMLSGNPSALDHIFFIACICYGFGFPWFFWWTVRCREELLLDEAQKELETIEGRIS
jgi:hypothetical protein